MIWGFASGHGRLIPVRTTQKTIPAEDTSDPNRPDIHLYAFRSVNPFPPIMHACYDARKAVMRHHELAFGVEEQFPDLAHVSDAAGQIFFRPACDTICPMPMWKAEHQRVFVDKMRDQKVEKIALSDYSCHQAYLGETDRWGDYQTHQVITPRRIDWMTEDITEITLWTQSEALPFTFTLDLIDYRRSSLPIPMSRHQLESCEHSLKSITLYLDELIKARKEQRYANKKADDNRWPRVKVLNCPQWLYHNINDVDNWEPPVTNLKWHLSAIMQVASLAKVVTTFIGGYVSALVEFAASKWAVADQNVCLVFSSKAENSVLSPVSPISKLQTSNAQYSVIIQNAVLDTLEWTTSSLDSLCTTASQTGLAALHFVSQTACPDDTFFIDGNSMSLHDLVDLIDYKWGLICLKDTSTNDYCLDVEDSWNITTMVANGAATWPVNPQKCYLDSSQGVWEHLTDENGTCIEPDWEELDNDDNYGWVSALDFDEYPLEIQCSSCFLQKFKVGYESAWGNTWDEVTEQVWANMQRNCELNEVLTPAHNVSGVIVIDDIVSDPPPVTTDCPQNISISSSEIYTCQEAVVKFGIPSAGLYNLNNDLDCSGLTDRTICAPMSCPILVVNTGATDFANANVPVSIVASEYTNLTLADFYSYNYFISYDFVVQNHTVCIGPPIQIYQPSI
ncbi:hypothetical protein SBOR_6750 [Sclerotinia borealis F-4128]|uniref:2EXR domain-containing protein n=1 Tax=Sclerotinia borealis (strain F-4128) TaxID=1432307 RepID=W9C825_SCLBF|nr:hypothetical protein SBOR_6750 [Sclerotinia borealis F-4128]